MVRSKLHFLSSINLKQGCNKLFQQFEYSNSVIHLGPVHICQPANLALQGPGTCPVIAHHNLGNQVPDKPS